jgi:hypothetical protein
MGLRIFYLFQNLKYYFEIHTTAVTRKKPPITVNNFEHIYKHKLILEKVTLLTIPIRLNLDGKS